MKEKIEMAKSRLEAIKARAKQIDSGGSDRAAFLNTAKLGELGIDKYKVTEKNWICIIPPKDETAYYGMPLEVHYRIGAAGDTFLCLERMFGKPCPICDERNRLYAEGDVEKSIVKPLFPSRRCLFLVVDYRSEETRQKGIQLFDAPFGVEQGAKKVSTNKRTGEVGDISDPDIGKVLYFDCENPGKPTAKYDGYDVEDRERLNQEWLDSVVDFSEILIVPTTEEVAESFLGGVSNSGKGTSEPEPESDSETESEPTSKEIVDHIADDIESGSAPEPEAEAEPVEKKGSNLSDVKARIAAARAKAKG